MKLDSHASKTLAVIVVALAIIAWQFPRPQERTIVRLVPENATSLVVADVKFIDDNDQEEVRKVAIGIDDPQYKPVAETLPPTSNPLQILLVIVIAFPMAYLVVYGGYSLFLFGRDKWLRDRTSASAKENKAAVDTINAFCFGI